VLYIDFLLTNGILFALTQSNEHPRSYFEQNPFSMNDNSIGIIGGIVWCRIQTNNKQPKLA
jgi:hypothetical protein